MNLSAPVLPDGRALAALTVPFVHLANVPSAPDMMRDTLQLIQGQPHRRAAQARRAERRRPRRQPLQIVVRTCGSRP